MYLSRGMDAGEDLRIKVIPLNLKAVDPAPCSDRHEVCHADKLIIAVNNNDSDDDGIVDWSDSDIPGGDPDLAKITLEKPAGAVASDISGNITVKFSPKVKAFKDPNKATGLAPTSYSFSALPVDIYLEGNTPSSSVLDANVWAEMTLDSGVECHDEIWYTVIQVDIVRPKGSLDAVKNPEASWLSSSSRFDFQGLISTATGPYVLGIVGDIDPDPPVDYKWTLDAAAGTLSDDTTDTPDHTAPATEGQGMLKLKAMFDTTDTGFKEERKVKIYKDHLERDYVNFETGGSCDVGWKVTTFNVDPQPVMIKWNCHGSTNHACDGSGNGGSSGLSSVITNWNKDTFNAPINWSNVLAVLDRGDVVAYYADSSLQHSATCINSTTTWGANNEPVSGTETWKWYLATPQNWWNNAGINNPPMPDCTKIIVYNKP